MRSLLLVVVVVVVTAAGASHAQTCTVGQPETCTVDGDLEFCRDGVLEVFSCEGIAAGSSCAPLDCIGSGCPTDAVRCENVDGGPCFGIGPLFDADTANDVLLGAVPCESGSVCLLNAGTETCALPPAGVPGICAVTDAGINCRGTFIVSCIGFSAGNVGATPGVIDCREAGADFVCDDSDGIRCINPACGIAGAGRCDGGTAVSCEGGSFVAETDCLTLGQACIQDDPAQTPFCATPDAACGASGLGVCTGDTAIICAGGQVSTTTDCSGVGRVCGAIDATGRIGCVVPGGEGEGEGEGEAPPECTQDSDCDDGDVCDDGECERDRARDGGEPVAPAPGLFSCAHSGSLLPASALFIGALLLRRRRRSLNS